MNAQFTLRDHALEYARTLKLAVFPLVPGTKRPLTKNGFLDATTDLTIIDGWWKKWPNANIGCATGLKSGVAVLDFDPKPDAWKIATEFQADHIALAATALARSGGGGYHFYYAVTTPLPSKNGLRHGVDFKADGGYIVLPPSVHPTGNKYEWIGRADSNALFTPIADWLEDLMRAPSLAPPTGSAQVTSRAYHNIIEDVNDGHRTETLVSLAGHLFRSTVDPRLIPAIVFSVNQTKFKPPLSNEKVMSTLNSIAGRELKKLKGLCYE